MKIFEAKNITLVLATAMLWFTPVGISQAHDISHEIDNCACDKACYTGEVTDLTCSGGEAKFKSSGLPNHSHALMVGITASNQQFPITHNHETTIPLSPREAGKSTPTVPGPIGIAVNGISLFSPDTQGPIIAGTGRPANTYDIGELDDCGGHAGRGDDYHYHIAPTCLIDELGADHVDVKKRPIGYAMDGFPILALGWFDSSNDIEGLLDECRGIHDASDQYFYNVRHEAKYDILDCFTGTQARGFGRDSWVERIDQYGREIVGTPVGFVIKTFEVRSSGNDLCQVMTGTLVNEQLLQTNGSVKNAKNKSGTLFYCNSGCYGQFFVADDSSSFKGRAMYHERPTDNCPAVLGLAGLTLFEAYEGPKQSNSQRSPN